MSIGNNISGGGALAVIGDFKSGFQLADHSGWIKLDGRLKTALTATQQTAATGLGFGVNIPNAADLSPIGASGTKAVGSTGGSATAVIAQANLPNVNLSGGSHSHGVTDPGHGHGMSPFGFWYYAGAASGRIPTANTPGLYSADATGSIVANTTGITINLSGALSIPLGGSGTALPIQNPYLAMTPFIYLGP